MPSRADTLKVAQADVATIADRISSARRGRGFMRDPDGDVEEAVRLLDKTTNRLRKSFGVNGTKR